MLYKNILIGLDLSHRDEFLLRYVSEILPSLHAQKIYFLHVIHDYEAFQQEHPKFLKPVDENIISIMKKKAEKIIHTHKNIDFHFEISEGHTLTEILRKAKLKDIDLLITGRRLKIAGGSKLPEKLARKAPCSVLVVPEDAHIRLQKLFVPIDFSEQSKLALESAYEMSKSIKGATLIAFHAASLQPVYQSHEFIFRESEETLREKVKIDYNNFMKKIGSMNEYFKPLISVVQENNPAEYIKQNAYATDSDLVIIGSKGRSNAASVLLGSVAENLIWLSSIPCLVVKEKGSNMDFLNVILSIQ